MIYGKDIRHIISNALADDTGLERFLIAMREKLERKRGEGRKGWNLPKVCSLKSLRKMLNQHIEKGDMVDIANLAMMIWNREHPDGISRTTAERNGADRRMKCPRSQRDGNC